MKSKKRIPILAAFLSCIGIGLGQIYNTQLKKGIIFFLVLMLCPFLIFMAALYFHFVGMVIVLLLSLTFILFMIIDAWYVAAKKKVTVLKSYNTFDVYLFYALITGLIFNLYFFGGGELISQKVGIKMYSVSTASMEPTLLIGDHIFVDKNYYKRNEPQKKDLVLFQSPQDSRYMHLKRVVAMEGDKIKIRNKQVFINDKLIREAYIPIPTQKILTEENQYDYIKVQQDNFGPAIVPENHCFILGDNRDNSYDSRHFGFLPLKNIKGKPLFICFSSQLESIDFVTESNLKRLFKTLFTIRPERIGLNFD
ncbi:MAG: signal peptidase I [Candidatus Aminicenantaceae bacterium]